MGLSHSIHEAPCQSKIRGNPLRGASMEMPVFTERLYAWNSAVSPVFTDGWMLQSQKAG